MSLALKTLKDGIAAAQAGDRQKAAECLREAVRIDPKNETAWMWLASVVESPQEALDALHQVLALNPQSHSALNQIKGVRLEAGIAAAKAHDSSTARKLFKLVLKDDPNDQTALLWLAGSYDEPELSLPLLEKLLRINPQHLAARTGIEQCRRRLQPAFACPICLHTDRVKVDVCPSCGCRLDVLQLDAILENLSIDREKVQTGIRRLQAKLDGTVDANTYYFLGLALLNLQNLDEAILSFEGAFKLKAGDRALKVLLHQLQLRQQSLEFAEEATAPSENLPPAILVIDDSPNMRKLMAFVLANAGYRVLQAESLREADEILREDGPFQMIVLDGDLDDLEWRKRPAVAKIPLAISSRNAGLVQRMRARMSGASGFLAKPFQPEWLLRLVRASCRAPAPTPKTL